jgi:thioredoxin reductase (NADPH)
MVVRRKNLRAMDILDIAIIGAGPCGLACAIEAQKSNLKYLVIDKGSITESIRRYPINMIFFSTSENLEIGDIPFVSMGMRPTRLEALKYYRKISSHFNLNLKLFTKAEDIVKGDGFFRIKIQDGEIRSRKIILATGYYDIPRFLNIPGEALPHVNHYYDEAFKYSNMKVVVVGGANSAIETSLDLYRNGAIVTIVHIFEELAKNAKYWIVPDLQNRIKNNEVKSRFSSVVTSISEKTVTIKSLKSGEMETLEADFVFLMTGYRPDAEFLTKVGIKLSGENLVPEINPDTFETNIPGIYMAGSIIGGEETAKVFIENGRLHGAKIVEDIKKNIN